MSVLNLHNAPQRMEYLLESEQTLQCHSFLCDGLAVTYFWLSVISISEQVSSTSYPP